jgi:adenylate cyclase class 2
MPMCVEIEAKLKVRSHKKIIGQLSELGAKFLAEQTQKDYYFDNIGRTLTKTDRCLRLREQLINKSKTFSLTYKGAREKGKFKKRQEIETEISDGEAVEKLLSELGYKKVLVVKKSRQVWRFGGCEIALDSLPLLGRFVEIEGRSNRTIAAVQKKLGLAGLQHIPESYAMLAAEKLNRKNKGGYET